MSVRKRHWPDPKLGPNEGWQADYVDNKGVRRRKMFARKKEADAFLLTAKGEVRDGTHVADSETVTVTQAGELWIKSGEAAGLERTTIEQRRQHLDLHIVPFIGDLRLNKMSVPGVRTFQDQLRENGRSTAMIKRVTVSLGGILGDAQDRTLTVRNVVHERSRTRSNTRAAESRAKPVLQVGVDIPSRDEIKAFLNHATGRWRPLFLVATFTGMRASELRGLAWSSVDFEAKTIRVQQRADRFGKIGRPKSKAGNRTIPVPPIVVNAMREWKLACPLTDTGRRDAEGKAVTALDLAFPNGAGKIESHANIVNRGLVPTMIAAGIAVPVLDEQGKPVLDPKGKPAMGAKYSGLHSLRHFFSSWCINPVSQGGQGLTPKAVQERMGHASIVMTLDVYGHLFPRNDDDAQLAAAAAALLT